MKLNKEIIKITPVAGKSYKDIICKHNKELTIYKYKEK